MGDLPPRLGHLRNCHESTWFLPCVHRRSLPPVSRPRGDDGLFLGFTTLCQERSPLVSFASRVVSTRGLACSGVGTWRIPGRSLVSPTSTVVPGSGGRRRLRDVHGWRGLRGPTRVRGGAGTRGTVRGDEVRRVLGEGVKEGSFLGRVGGTWGRPYSGRRWTVETRTLERRERRRPVSGSYGLTLFPES